jgi:hypothetical protein
MTEKWTFTPINQNKEYILPLGKYYIGDIFYPLMESNRYYDIYSQVGLYKNKKDELILVNNTHKGDGTFLGSDNYEYMVDTQTLGIMSYSICPDNNSTAGGHVYNFLSDVTVTMKDGIFTYKTNTFTLVIDTSINIENKF